MVKADIGIVGLGVMGSALARNFQSRGLCVAAYDRHPEVVRRFEHADVASTGRVIGCTTWKALAASLAPPRIVIAMVTAGPAVDAITSALRDVLEPGDVVVDGGNSHYADTDRRLREAGGLRFVGMGVSGGEEGALRGPAMMPGGDPESWALLRPLLESAAARSQSGPCVDWCGRGSAGHFVKMVHNGIEYGDMQLIAEVTTLLRDGLGLSPRAAADVFARWNEGPLESYLIEITSQIVGARDPEGAGPLLDAILDVAGQKGTGRWTAMTAYEHGVAAPTVTAAVDARVLSAMKTQRIVAERLLGRPGGGTPGLTVAQLEGALYAAKLCAYTQGFALLDTASLDRDYGIDRARVARIWEAGCIIRAAFLGRVRKAFDDQPDLPLLMLAPDFSAELSGRIADLRAVVGAAVAVGIPVPALGASLAYVDSLARGRGSASLIQAQRDFFGAHTYRRLDRPDEPVHTDWEAVVQLDIPST